MAGRKLRKVQRQIFFAGLMERADHATLEQTPEGFDIVGMNVPAHILFSGLVQDLMRMGKAKALLAVVPIGRNQRTSCPTVSRTNWLMVHGQPLRSFCKPRSICKALLPSLL